MATGLSLTTASHRTPASPAEASHNRIHLNQVGYLPGEAKRAVVAIVKPPANPTFQLLDEQTGAVHYSGELTTVRLPKPEAREHDRIADFSAWQRPGRYRLRLSDGTLSPPFGIGATLYASLFPLMENYFDIQQCGPQTSPKRRPCHLDDGVIRGGPHDGKRFDATGGWHDAGDYMKFVETTSYAVALMLLACDLRPQLAAVPAGTTALSPLLARARVGLDWLLKMHPSPQEFYYQVGDKNDHNRWRLPEHDSAADLKSWHARPVFFGIGANLAGRTAAAFAMASRLYKSADPAFAVRCLNAAQTVYRLGRKHPRPLSTQPNDFYPEESSEDDMEWGATELFKATRNPAYLKQALTLADSVDASREPVSVYTTNSLAHFALYPHATGEARDNILGYLKADADHMRQQMHGAYGLATPYVWGTAEVATGAALTCLLYAARSGDKSAADVALRQRDYNLGCNPFGLSCLIGAGTRFPQAPHHQVAAIGKFQLNGALIAGPASLKIFDAQDFGKKGLEYSVPSHQVSQMDPDQVGVYQDSVHDYVINEPALDYTAQFLLLAAFYLPKQ